MSDAGPRPPGGEGTTGWRHIPHDADIGLVGVGPTRAEAFRQAALALAAVVTDPGRVGRTMPVRIHCAAADDELLLFDWLNALIFEMAVRRVVFGDFSVSLIGQTLDAVAWGEPVDRARHEPAVEVKGATMTGLRVARVEGSWRAECIVDV